MKSLLALFCLALSATQSFGAGIISSDPRFQIPATDESVPGAGVIRRHDWFQRIWTEQRTQFAQRTASEQGRILFLGDSITQGWGDVGSFFPGIPVANRGISGDTTRGVLLRLKDDVLATNPRAIVLLIGTNDLEEFVPPEVIAANMRLILTALKEHNGTLPIILCKVFPSSATKNRPSTRITKLNELYAEVARDFPQVTLLDTWALFADVQGDAVAGEFPDLLHPNGLGYAKWAAALRPMFETLGLAPMWPDTFTAEDGFTNLFNGRDLSGWQVPGGQDLKGQTGTPDGRYRVLNGRLVVPASRKGDPFRQLYTTRQFSRDFVLKLEFRASPNADSGLYIREPQLQCRDYVIAGPFHTLRAYRPLEWNEIVVTVKGGVAHSTCNGETLVDAMPVPPSGPLGIESDRGQVEFRRIRLQELP